MVIKSVDARCINCKREVKAGQEQCACGDRVAPRGPVADARIRGYEAGDQEALERVSAFVRRTQRHAWETELAPEQVKAVEAVQGWFMHSGARQKPFRLFGPAGTGKTTLAKHLPAALGANVVFGAYTGKAAHVLRRKGVPADTIHSSIYMLDQQMKLRARRWEAMRELAELEAVPGMAPSMQAAQDDVRMELVREIEQIEIQLRRPAFTLNEMSPWSMADLIVLDEVSMVNERMAADIESFGVPVLVLGDPAQLPPIEGGGHYTAAEPDVLLTQVHRQALESPVLKLATDIRLGLPWRKHLVKVDLAEAMQADQVLCWKNSTRWSLVTAMRKKLGRPQGIPVPGDRVMCLVNNKDIGVLNGQQYEVLGVKDGVLTLRDDDGQEREIAARMEAFKGLEQEQAEKRAGAWRGEEGCFTFANAITCHKAQGSEWPHVYVVDQTHQMTRSTTAERRAWAYTSVTRASERVTIASTEV
jgi:exodeoxyribonuclease V